MIITIRHQQRGDQVLVDLYVGERCAGHLLFPRYAEFSLFEACLHVGAAASCGCLVVTASDTEARRPYSAPMLTDVTDPAEADRLRALILASPEGER